MENSIEIIRKPQLTSQIFSNFLGDCVEQYLTVRRYELQPKSLKTYTESLNVMISYFGSDRKVETITQTELIYFLGSIDRKPSGVFMVWQTIGFFFKWFYKEDYSNNPMLGWKMKRPKSDPIGGIDPQQVEKILKKISGSTAARDKALISVLFASALRDTEFCSLKLQDINPRTGQINVSSVSAKGRKFRQVYILDQPLKLLNKYLKRIPDPEITANLWQTQSGQPLTESGIRDIVSRSCSAAGLPSFSFHDFRRGCALTMYRKGADIKTISHFLGHSDLKVTERYLALEDKDNLAAAVQFSPLK